jgi:hypothetical protein
MKPLKSLFVFLFLFAATSFVKGQPEGTASKENAVKNSPEIYFAEFTYDYGTIKKNSKATCEFVFKNTGDQPLVLDNVKTSCGCTVPTWPKKPILPGKSGTIKVVYNTKKTGTFFKTITVMSNAKTDPVELSIKGTVIE